VPALAVLERGKAPDSDECPVPVWNSIQARPNPGAATTAGPAEAIVPLIYDRRASARKVTKKRWGRPSGAGTIVKAGCHRYLDRDIPTIGRLSARSATGSIEVIDVLADFKPEATRGIGFRFFGYGD